MEDGYLGYMVNPISLRVLDYLGNDRRIVAVYRPELALVEVNVGRIVDLDLVQASVVIVDLPGPVDLLTADSSYGAQEHHQQ